MQEKKAENIVVLDLRNLKSSIADRFIICEASNDKQVAAISDSVEEVVRKQCGEKAWHVEGKEKCDWVLIDYIDTIVHIFKPDTRSFYGLEELWGDADRQEIA
jgi:ribosome-associated protein